MRKEVIIFVILVLVTLLNIGCKKEESIEQTEPALIQEATPVVLDDEKQLSDIEILKEAVESKNLNKCLGIKLQGICEDTIKKQLAIDEKNIELCETIISEQTKMECRKAIR